MKMKNTAISFQFVDNNLKRVQYEVKKQRTESENQQNTKPTKYTVRQYEGETNFGRQICRQYFNREWKS